MQEQYWATLPVLEETEGDLFVATALLTQTMLIETQRQPQGHPDRPMAEGGRY